MSRGDSTLAMLLKIEGDPTSADASVTEVREQVAALAAQVTAAAAPTENLSLGHRRMASEMTEARHALKGFGEEIGVHMPRFIAGFITGLEGVGPVLASAFSGVAILGIIQLVAEQLPKAFAKLTEELTGWGEAARKEYDSVLEANRKVEEGLFHFQMKLNDAMGKGVEANLEMVQKRLADNQRQIVQLTATIDGTKSSTDIYSTTLRAISAGLIDTKDNTDALQHQLEGLKKTHEELTALQTRLADDYAIHVIKQDEELYKEGSKLVKEGGKLQEERTKKHYEEVLKRQEHEQAAWNAHVKFDEESRKYDEESAKKLTEATAEANRLRFEMQKFFWEEQRKGETELSKEIIETTRARTHELIRNIVEVGKIRIEEEKKAIDADINQQTAYWQGRLSLGRISQMRFNEQSRGLLEDWYAKHKEILDRQVAAAMAAYGRESLEYAKLIRDKEALDRDYQIKHAQAKNAEEKANKAAMDSALTSLQNIGAAMGKHHELEKAVIVARAAIKAAESIADSVRAFALGDYVQGALFALAAVEYGVVAAGQVSGAGGGSAAGASAVPAGGVGTAAAQPLAPGATPGPARLNVVVMGQDEQAQYFAKMLTTGVRTQGVQLAASHAADGTALA